MLQKLMMLAIAGASGTLARYALASLVHQVDGLPARWGTVAVNLTGCFLAGFLWTLFETRWAASTEMRLIVLIGFMGAFTTFSAIILEASELVRTAQWVNAAGHIVLQNVLGFVGLYLGVMLSRNI